jgi:hypothetical protein
LKFQPIDLRWGVPAEAAAAQHTLGICLTEVRRCRETSGGPFFLALLGDRAGWHPLTEEIPAAEWRRLLATMDGDARATVRRWYRRDRNAIPPVLVLQSREGRFRDPVVWAEEERRIQMILATASTAARLSRGSRLKYEAAATEQEVMTACSCRVTEEDVFVFVRRLRGVPRDPSSAPFLDRSQSQPNRTERSRVRALVARLRRDFGSNVRAFTVHWRGGTLSQPDLEAFAVQVEHTLTRTVLHLAALVERRDRLDEELARHRAFADERAASFRGRARSLARVLASLASPDRRPLAVLGAAGSGKSSLLATVCGAIRVTFPHAAIIYRSIGVTPESTTGAALLRSLCQEFDRHTDAARGEIPHDLASLEGAVLERIANAAVQRRIVIVLDALDQLDAADEARLLRWFPSRTAAQVRLVVSAAPSTVEQALVQRLPRARRVRLPALGRADGRAIVAHWLAEQRRSLTREQKRAVVEAGTKTGLPLGLRLAFQESCRWRSYETPPAFGSTVPSLVALLVTRLSDPRLHGAVFVRRCLANLSAGRAGLTEDEIQRILWADKNVRDEVVRRFPKSPCVGALPPILWSRFL